LTAEKFITKAQGYYGKYTAEQRKTVMLWLSRRSEKAISLIWAEVLKAFSAAYKMPPCIKELEDAWAIVYRDRAYELRQKQLELLKPEGEPMSEEAAKEAIAMMYETIGFIADAKRVRAGM